MMRGREKLLIVASWYPSEASAVSGIFVEEQAQVLAREYDVAVVVPEALGVREQLTGGRRTRLLLECRQGIPTVRVASGALLPGSLRRFMWMASGGRIRPTGSLDDMSAEELNDAAWFASHLRAGRRGLKLLSRVWGRPGLIHAHVVIPGGWVALQLAKDVGVPVVVTEHAGPFAMHLSTRYRRRLVAHTLGRVDRVIAVSPTLRGEIAECCSEARVVVIGNLVRTEYFTPECGSAKSRAGEPTRFLTVAGLTRPKGIDIVLHACRRILDDGHGRWSLTIAGDGPLRHHLMELAMSLGLQGHCHFVGKQTRESVRALMRACDVFVLASRHESFGIVLGEAMACGKPVVATRCGGPEFVVAAECGVLVDRDNVEALAQGLKAMMKIEGSAKSAYRREQVVARFGEGALLRQLGTVYSDVVRETMGATGRSEA